MMTDLRFVYKKGGKVPTRWSLNRLLPSISENQENEVDESPTFV